MDNLKENLTELARKLLQVDPSELYKEDVINLISEYDHDPSFSIRTWEKHRTDGRKFLVFETYANVYDYKVILKSKSKEIETAFEQPWDIDEVVEFVQDTINRRVDLKIQNSH